MGWPIMMHANACEQGQTLEEICRNCARWGFDGVEFRRKRVDANEDAESYLDAIHRVVEKYKVSNVLFGSPGIQKLSGDAAEREQELEELVRFYEMAVSRFPLTICNTLAGPIINPDHNIPYMAFSKHGSAIANEQQWQWAVSCYKILGELARRLGFRFAFETHMCYLNDTLESTLRLVREIGHPSVGINLDYGNLVYFDNPPSFHDVLDITRDKLYYVHLKNSIGLESGERMPVGLSAGEINNREILKALLKAGYKGPLCIEVPRNGDREWFAREDIRYLKELMVEIQ